MCRPAAVPRSSTSEPVHVAEDHQVLVQVEHVQPQSPTGRGCRLSSDVAAFSDVTKTPNLKTETKTKALSLKTETKTFLQLTQISRVTCVLV